MKKSEKEMLLEAATPEEWDQWLSCLAYNDDGELCGQCLFCKAYPMSKQDIRLPANCPECIPVPIDAIHTKGYRCNARDFHGYGFGPRLDAAIARLEKAGVFDET